MSKYFLIILFVICFSKQSEACSQATIESMTFPINSYKPYVAEAALEAALDNLTLCDENLFFAGEKVALQFNSYKELSTRLMTNVVISKSRNLNSELANGLGLGLIAQLNLYKYNTTVYFLESIVQLGTDHQLYAKQFALELLKHSNSHKVDANNRLLEAVKTLRELATPPQAPEENYSSIWSFRSEERTCKTMNGPWGEYYPCPKYTASVSDAKGNRLILSCRSNEYGINFRIRPSREMWSNISNKTIETVSFGTNKINQQMGFPYLISEDSALYVEEPISEELLERLKADNSLTVRLRLNSGESSAALTYKLGGSNKAITKLMSYCQ